MRVWVYALKEGLRYTVGLALAVGLTVVLTWLIFCGFRPPPNETFKQMMFLVLVAILIGFPASVVSIRLEIRKANRMKVN